MAVKMLTVEIDEGFTDEDKELELKEEMSKLSVHSVTGTVMT